jgi:hypothetical protein
MHRLNIRKTTIYEKTSEIELTSLINTFDTTPQYSQPLLKTRFKAFRKILSFIDQSAPEGHNTRVFYPYVPKKRDTSTDVCPYCFALNLWLRYVQAYPYSPRQYQQRSSYHYFDQLSDYNFFIPFALTHCDSVGLKRFYTSEVFITWIYERDLLFCFIELLTVMLSLFENKERWWDDPILSDNVIKKRVLSLRQAYFDHFFYVFEGKLNFYYNLKCPLELFNQLLNVPDNSNCVHWKVYMKGFKNKLLIQSQNPKAIRSVQKFKEFEEHLQSTYLSSNDTVIQDSMTSWYAQYANKTEENKRLYSQLEMGF